jgi:hypothetical protein
MDQENASLPPAEPRHVRIGLLLELYGSLLTERQRDFVRLHFDEDQSFAEIAQCYTISRQAVYDTVRHAQRSLEEYESHLRLLEKGMPKVKEILRNKPLTEAELKGTDADETGEDEGEGETDARGDWALETASASGSAASPMVAESPAVFSTAAGGGVGLNREQLQPIADGLVALRRRIARSGGIIYDTEGFNAEVHRLLNLVNDLLERSGPGSKESGDV